MAGPAAGPHAEARFVRQHERPLEILVQAWTGEGTTMGRSTFTTLMLLAPFLTSSCHSATDVTQGTSLPAPEGLFASAVVCSQYTCGLTFSFNAVEFAESYLIYYNSSNDTSTASPLAAGQFSPIGWSYDHAKPFGGATYYFWVRAYDGKNYGRWSTSISSVLY